MKSQIKIGQIFGIKIGLHYSWFLIALLIIFSLSGEFHARNPQWSPILLLVLAILTTILFFASLLLHELSHSLVARARGLSVREITLFALGGMSQIEGEVTSAKTEFWMALAGPATSVVIGLVCIGVIKVTGGILSRPFVAVLSWLGYINVSLAIFNMIPGYPLDGGRILRSAIWWRTGDMNRSTRIAAKTGQVIATTFIVLGIMAYFGGGGISALWIAFIGWFLLQAAKESYLQVDLQRILKDVRVRDVMTRDCPIVNVHRNIRDFVDHELLRTGRRCFIVEDDGAISGLITPHEIKQKDQNAWPYTELKDVMRPLASVTTMTPDSSLGSALDIMARADLNQLPVILNGRLEGIVSRAEILSYFQTLAELQS